jgi:hypothetical protein
MQGLKHMFGYRVQATDGQVGKVEDFFVEEATWSVRYMVVRTGGLLSGERVLTPINCISSTDVDRRTIEVPFSRSQMTDHAPPDGVHPVSTEMEAYLKTLYGGADYRRDHRLIRVGCELPQTPRAVSSLRSVREITSYRIETLEGPCGLCTDLLADPANWSIPYLVINTKEWMPHGHVLIPSAWVRHISWQEMQTDVAVHRPRIQKAQRFDPTSQDVRHGSVKPLHQTA